MILRSNGRRFVVYPDDHPPAHVPVVGPGWLAVVNQVGVEMREAMGCREPDARRVVRPVNDHQAILR